jgi:hypothetical protein
MANRSRLMPALVGALVVSGASCATAQGTKAAPAEPSTAAAPAQTPPQSPPATADERVNDMLVRFKEGTTDAQRAETHALVKGARTVRRFTSVSGLEQVALPPGITVDEALAIYRKSPHVQYAEPNRAVRVAPAPAPK